MANNVNIPETIKSYKIEKETYKLLTTTLYTGINTDINEKVLIHIFQKEKIKTRVNELTLLNNQVFFMKLLNHRNILKLYEIIETKDHIFIIYEYFEGVKLSDLISKKKKLSEEETFTILKEILSASFYFHGMYLCNLNLSSNNILIDSKFNIKICDFKYGHFYSTKDKSKVGLIGDHYFTSPELHSKKNYNPELADMWSIGVILYQMLTGNLPFSSKKDLDLIRSIIKGDYIVPNYVNENLKSIIKGLIEKNEDKRFKLNDLFNQKYFKDKKLDKNSLIQGLNVLTMKYPVDLTALNICKNNFKIDVAVVIKSLENNRFTPVTSLFKQIVSKLANKGIQTINDLVSDKFISYINEHNNYLKEEEQFNNIHKYLRKEEDIRKNSKDVAAILLNNQNEISKGLEDLKKQFENAKKGAKEKRQKSVDFGRPKKTNTFKLHNNRDFIQKFNNLKPMANDISPNKKKNPNIKTVKRNTVLLGDYKGLKLSQKNKNAKKGVPDIGNQSGGRVANVNKDEKDKKEENKIVEEIKEEENKNKESEKSSSSSENSLNLSRKSEKSEEKEKKEEGNKKAEQGDSPKLEKLEKPMPSKKEENNIEKKSSIKKKISHSKNNQFNPMFAVKLNKVMPNINDSEKPKKVMVNKPQNDMNSIKKKLDNNDKKNKINLKKEEIEREMNIMKIKNELKKGQKTSSVDNRILNSNKKAEPPKAQGFKNIKEMIEANLKQQKDKKKIPGVK